MVAVLYHTRNGRLADSFQTDTEAKTFIRALVAARTVSCPEDIKVLDREWAGNDEFIDANDYMGEGDLFQLPKPEPQECLIDSRKWSCNSCKSEFWVDCDDTDYPNYCPFCGEASLAKVNDNYKIAI